MKTECDYLHGWIKKQSHKQKSHQKMVNPRDIAGNAEEEANQFYGCYHYKEIAIPVLRELHDLTHLVLPLLCLDFKLIL